MLFSPSELIRVGESMSRMYGLGGEWLVVGLQLIEPSIENRKRAARSKQVLAEKWNIDETHGCQIPGGGCYV